VTREFSFGVVGALLSFGCVHAQPPSRVSKVFTPPPPVQPLPRAEFRGYRLAPSYLERSSFRDGAPLRTGALVSGLRVRTDSSGLLVAGSVASPPLLGGAPLSETFGGGLLFWNATALYSASSFLDPLQPLVDVGFTPAELAFAPNFLLVRGSDGQRVAIDWHTLQRAPLSPPLLVDIVSHADGRSLALLEGGACAESHDAGKSYRTLTLPSGAHAVSVTAKADRLFATLSSGSILELEKAGATRLQAAVEEPRPRPAPDALWPVPEPPIERALRFGVPIGEEFSAVAVGGAVATVNLRTGELVQMTRALVPSDLDCRVLGDNAGLLLVCSAPSRGSIVLSGVFGESPRTLAKFPAGVKLRFAEGVLLAEARCNGEVHPGAVCVHPQSGPFVDYDVSSKLGALVAAPGAAPSAKAAVAPSVSRFIPKQGGGAVALVVGPAPGLLDAASGVFTPLTSTDNLLDVASDKSEWLGLRWVALGVGGVRGWSPNGAVVVTAEGRIEPSIRQFSSLFAAGARAFAFDRARHAFQSNDWGQTWVETLAPPGVTIGKPKPAAAMRCSAVGCHLGAWLRVGWEAEVPAPTSRATVAAAPPPLAPIPIPILSCQELAPPSLSDRPAPADSEQVGLGVTAQSAPAGDERFSARFTWSVMRPQSGSLDALGLRATVVGKAVEPPAEPKPDELWPGLAAPKQYSFVSAFDPSAELHRAAVSWRALFVAARRVGAPDPAMDAANGSETSGLPVLGHGPAEADGLILDDGAPLWMHEVGAPEAFFLHEADPSFTTISALAAAPHTLDVLRASDDGTEVVSEISDGRARRLFQIPGGDARLYPANADALAWGPHGALAVLRTRSGIEPPSTTDPALLLDENGVKSVLAPWSRLFLASAPECKPAADDARAILQTRAAWLRVVEGGASANADSGMFAIVRGNAERLCLEAVELGAEPAPRRGEEVPARIVARFVGAHPGAARIGLESGFEFRQPLACSLLREP